MVRVACVGVRGQGQSHIRAYAKMPNVEIAALCDVDESVLNQRLRDAEGLTGKRPAAFTELRKLLEEKNIDAIFDSDTKSLALAAGDLGLPGGKRCLC